MRPIYRFILPFSICLIVLAADVAARPPMTLDYGFIKYEKSSEMLLKEPVLHVMIKDADLRPYALIFDGRIAFINKDRKVISELPLPPSTRISTRESARSTYLSIYGNIANSNRGFIRLYDDKGKLLFSRDSVLYNDRIPPPLPLEKSRRLVFARDGALTVTNFYGDTLAAKSLLASDSIQDGDINIALFGKRDEFLIAANKYQVPTGKESDYPTLYHFNSNLGMLSHSILPYLLVSSLRCTPDGKYLQFQAEFANGKNQKIIKRSFPSPIDQPLELEDMPFVRFAVRNKDKPYNIAGGDTPSQKDLALIMPRRGNPQLLLAPDWKPFDTLNLPPPKLPWVDVALSPDGDFALFYNDNELVLWEARSGRLEREPFPYSFRRCFISNGGKRIVLAGDFGFVVYDSAR
jgi:hypothetical protein